MRRGVDNSYASTMTDTLWAGTKVAMGALELNGGFFR
ncbi:hypothetical protein EDD55_1106 [Varunaivibrio sulfuroxidans]|uniref:Uncharacterized protein n=1 Tax=Varunaivibrio sulfuroxidans TaxID=1773489 RepID=A0A4R3J5H7_9PROT|nr:hypothetical protein EDD55_1106 [Varunaivibrio sulfuroxidans]